MKDDYVKNGQLNVGYNLQLATAGQYALAYEVFPNPADMRTFISFLDNIKENFSKLSIFIVAMQAMAVNKIMKMWRIVVSAPHSLHIINIEEKKNKYNQNALHVDNWEYNEEEDSFICPMERN